MGFYGNITNTTRTQFQFDKIYPNRYTMDKNVHTDGIYVGRYVLVEYDQDYKVEDNFIQAYYNDENQICWDQKNEKGDIKRVPITKGRLGTFTFDDKTITPIIYIKNGEKIIFYKVTSERIFNDKLEEANSPITIEEDETIIDKKTSNYGENSAIDRITYGTDRGYDSTVWMKNYANGKEKYIMIAELNTVVPTFEVYPDAPSLTPVAPHFDKNSTNVYYPLHWQTTWGFRVKEGEEDKSDEQIKHNLATGKEDEIGYKGAIYYNKAGFNKETRSKADGSDYISIEPTGKSGNLYIDHTQGDNTSIINNKTVQPDILELSVILPSLGNAINDIWDMVYDYNNGETTINGVKPNNRYTDIDYKYPSSGSITDDKKTFNLNTLAGCINNYHNILGQNIYKTCLKNIENNEKDFYDKHYIYEVTNEEDQSKKYYRIHKEIPYVPGDRAVLGEAGNAQYSIIEIPGFENDMTTIYGLILDIKQLLATDIELNNTLDRNTVQGCINTINKIIDLYENAYGNSLIVFDNKSKKFSSAEVSDDDWIKYSIEGKGVSFTHATQENAITINNPKTDLTKGEKQLSISVPTFDKAGHINGQSATSINLPNTYTSFETIGISENNNTALNFGENTASAIKAVISSDKVSINPANKWVQIKMIGSSVTENNDTIEIAHSFSGVDTTKINEIYDNITANNADTDTIIIPAFIADGAGHVTGIEKSEIKIPYSFFKILVDSKDEQGQQQAVEANKIKDEINLIGDEKWISTKLSSSNAVSFEHKKIHSEQKNFQANYTSGAVKIPNINYDEAGHITEITSTTINLTTMSSEVTPDDGKVLTGLSLKENKELTPFTTNVCDLKLTGYSSNKNILNINANDTIQGAFLKIEDKINSIQNSMTLAYDPNNNNSITFRSLGESNEISRKEFYEELCNSSNAPVELTMITVDNEGADATTYTSLVYPIIKRSYHSSLGKITIILFQVAIEDSAGNIISGWVQWMGPDAMQQEFTLITKI